VLGASFEQSKEYVADVRERLMDEVCGISSPRMEFDAAADTCLQIRRVNTYKHSSLATEKNREDLQIVTKNLHGVSQTADSGMANVEMSMLLTTAMADLFEKHMPSRYPVPQVIQQTRESIKYVSNSWQSQKNWLINYKARKDTAMNFVSYVFHSTYPAEN
jgi:hypothetical protein